MKIMTTIYTIKRGGYYDRFIMMVEAFLERGWEVHCLSLSPVKLNHPYFHNHIIYFPFKKINGLISKLAVLFIFPLGVIKIGLKEKIDLIIAFGPLYAFIQGFANLIIKKPLITFLRSELKVESYFKNQNSTKLFTWINNFIENIGLRFSNQIITNNILSKENIFNRLRNKIDVQILFNNIPLNNNKFYIEDFYKTREKYGIPKEAKVLVTSGIINRGKNIEIIIRSFSKIKMSNIYMLIAGEGSVEADFKYKEYLIKLARKLEVDKQIIFAGWLEKEELWKVYKSSDLFVLASLKEGMPNAMLEALGVGLPCMGSDIPGIREILQYHELMFNPLDEDALTNKIRQFFSNLDFFSEIKRLCQDRKKEFLFDWKEKVFEMILSYLTTKGRKSIK